jgi:manganese oxidase
MISAFLKRIVLGNRARCNAWPAFAAAASLVAVAAPAHAAPTCARMLTAEVVAIDQPLMFNRLGAQNINGMVFALKRDIVNIDSSLPLSLGGIAEPGRVQLRADKRPRPLVLRIAQGDCLSVRLANLLTPNANPFKGDGGSSESGLIADAQVQNRNVSFTVPGMQLVNSIRDDGSYVGRNPNSIAAPGTTQAYTLYGEREGVFVVQSEGATFGSEGTQGNASNGLFGQIVVEPRGARIYRNTVSEEEMRLATRSRTAAGQPVINYEARYPDKEPWRSEGKARGPILNMIDGTEIVMSDMDAIVMGPNQDGSFPPSTYPLESIGKRNPSLPNRLEPFRDFQVAFHDEVATAQAFPGYFGDPVMGYVLDDTRDGFMINYGSAAIGAEIIANRLGVGPMHDCLTCAYEEFFLTAYTVGDPAMLVDIPANVGLENLAPGQVPPAGTTGIKATKALYPGDPSNVHHSYTGDFVKMRNTHVGKEQHIFHLHNHQWLFNPNDDNSNYVDAQGIGPGSGYTYEINFGGSGNRNKSAGDAIYHCHFYPHFAQGMWYLWRNHDVFEEGTRLAVSSQGSTGFHTTPFALRDGTPALGARALPDGELVVGTPIPAIVPLPGKAMPPMPGKVTVVPKVSGGEIVGSNARVDRSAANRMADGTLKNPGYPFWIAGIEDTVGQRPPTPPLDMLDATKAKELKASGKPLWSAIDPAQAGGWDGGLPRHALDGFKSGGESVATATPVDFSKITIRAKPVYFPEEGTDVEQAAMAFHAQRQHASYAVMPNGTTVTANFISNGAPPVAGAPYHEPCIDDAGKRLTAGTVGSFFSGEKPGAMSVKGSSTYSADRPRIYKGANIQFDAVFNKVGYHYPQERILTLWEDAVPVITKAKPPEPLVMRMNTFDCTMYHHTNLVPEYFEYDDYQVRTPTDIIGQHIHLPKWDLTTTDGSANGWNYEDGTLSPGAVRERIAAINAYNATRQAAGVAPVPTLDGRTVLRELAHPYFGRFGRIDWMGARTTMQRWFADPVVNVFGIDRGLGNIFTHDHFGPSTHQQIGLYGTVLTEPAGSTWRNAETGELLYDTSRRQDGGPTSWQAAILANDIDGDRLNDSYREFFLEYTDFQHAYEAGVYVGAGPDGKPDPTTYPATADSFRFAINPPGREQAGQVFPDLMVAASGGRLAGCPQRPCPQGISGDDPGMFTVNYRNEPVGLRIYDPKREGPDGKPGMQAAGLAGDLGYAFQTRTDRAIPEMNLAPSAIHEVTGSGAEHLAAPPYIGVTAFPPHINKAGDMPGDPFTPILRTYSGDKVRIRVQAGGDEEEHNISIHGVKWLQAGSGFGRAPNSGWKGAQAAGISEQFTFAAPVFMGLGLTAEMADYLYSLDSSIEGYWSGVWGVMRNYGSLRPDLYALPNNIRPVRLRNEADYNGVCPKLDPAGVPTKKRKYLVSAVLANDVLDNPLGLTIVPPQTDKLHVGGPLNADGGTLVFNSRPTSIPSRTIINDAGVTETLGGHAGPLHDPTAVMYLRTDDIDPLSGKLRPGIPVEPLILRANAGECIEVTLENRLPVAMPDLPTYAVMMCMVNRDRFDEAGVTTFNNNLMRPSSHVGLHAQLVSYDILSADGTNVGINPVQTVPPRTGVNEPYPSRTYQYYAGDLRLQEAPSTRNMLQNIDKVMSLPVEFGGFNLRPADLVKQVQKGLGGAMIIEPAGAAWTEDADMRAAATVTAPGQAIYRDFAQVWQRSLNQRWADGAAVENIASEGPGSPEDPQDNSALAINYRSEPLWYRFGRAPNALWGHANGDGLADVENAHMAYSNELVEGGGDAQRDPQTPIMKVTRGQPFRVHVMMPSGGSRNSTFALHGHVWPRDPYLAEKVDVRGFPLQRAGVGSVRIGDNPMSIFLGGQENVLPGSHWSFVFPSAGGAFAIPGDYLYRDASSMGNLGGFWGILRVD